MKPVEFGEIEWTILSDGSEDWYGLYEIRWSVSEAGPENVERRWDALRAAFERLISMGLVEIAIRPDNLSTPGEPLQPDEAIAAVRAYVNWEDPEPGRPVVTYTNTELGDRFYYGHGKA
jgi:hypothetical protein